ncbi:GAF domain-containing protein [Solimonas variicoloris]|uniref:GAF domain-containing protein n=1 Tax=Solimonas variicoloris TaxID=254408 RepID=UPI000A078972|nr:GAF domain-containing protein [Solimonas variicoloris]
MSNRHPRVAHLRGVRAFPRSALRRRRSAPLEQAPAGIAWAATSADDTVQQILDNTLRSACAVIGARGGFVVQLRDDTVLEIACAHALPGQDVFDAVLGTASRALHCALLEGRRGLACPGGKLLEARQQAAPAVISLPLELGARRQGAFCLLREDSDRALNELDFEILDALAGQAALALAAACQRSALNRLEASLNAIGPQTH